MLSSQESRLDHVRVVPIRILKRPSLPPSMGQSPKAAALRTLAPEPAHLCAVRVRWLSIDAPLTRLHLRCHFGQNSRIIGARKTARLGWCATRTVTGAKSRRASQQTAGWQRQSGGGRGPCCAAPHILGRMVGQGPDGGADPGPDPGPGQGCRLIGAAPGSTSAGRWQWTRPASRPGQGSASGSGPRSRPRSPCPGSSSRPPPCSPGRC